MPAVNFINIASEEYKSILDEMIHEWGEKSQIEKCIEECSELIKALCDLKNKRPHSIRNVISELADVSFTVDQISNIVGFDKVQEIKNYKFGRTISKLDGEKNNIETSFKEIEPFYEYDGKGFE